MDLLDHFDITEDELRAEMQNAIIPLYYGPGAFTVDDLSERDGCSDSTVYRHATRKEQSGEWVKVKVRRVVNDRPTIKAGWVRRDIYEQWERRQADE